MLYFENDYCEGAHPAILQKLTETNFEKVSGYGTEPKKDYFQIVLPGLTDDFICEGEVELSFLRFYQIPVCGNEYCIQSHPLQLREDTFDIFCACCR